MFDMNFHYILDEHGNPVPDPDLIKWVQWYQTAERHIGNTHLGPIHVSTVLLSLPHVSNDFEDERIMLYETMVFADEAIIEKLRELSETDDRSILSLFLGGSDIQKRYATKEEALEGHKNMCRFIEVCIQKELIQV